MGLTIKWRITIIVCSSLSREQTYFTAENIVPMYTVKSSIQCANAYSHGSLLLKSVATMFLNLKRASCYLQKQLHIHAEGQCIAGEQDD